MSAVTWIRWHDLRDAALSPEARERVAARARAELDKMRDDEGTAMKISIITTTCRSQPRLGEMARTIGVNAVQASVRSKMPVEFEWVIVDELHGTRHRAASYGAPVGWKEVEELNQRVPVVHIASAPSPVRSQMGKADLPDPATAKNTGLAAATGEYVLFLDDCHVLESGFLDAVADLAAEDQGFRAKIHSVQNMCVPATGVIQQRRHWGVPEPVKARSVAGACWGAPMLALTAIQGFDQQYAGQAGFCDLDACERLGRWGIQFFSTQRAWAIELRATQLAEEITTVREARRGHRNRGYYNQLLRDANRIGPVEAFDGVIEGGSDGDVESDLDMDDAASHESPPPAPPTDVGAPHPGDDSGAEETAAAEVTTGDSDDERAPEAVEVQERDAEALSHPDLDSSCGP